MATLLSIVTDALDTIGSFNVPTFLVGNEDDLARQLLSIAKDVGRELVRDYDWQQLGDEATVTTVASTSLYDFPEDFDRMAPDTMWETGANRNMRGHTTKRQWAAIKNVEGAVDNRYRWRVRGNKIEVFPTPTSVFSFTYEYLSKFYCTDSGGTPIEHWTADTDIPRLPEDVFIAGVRYYFRKAKTLPFGAAEAEYDAAIQKRLAGNVPSEAINMNHAVRALRDTRADYLNIPDFVDVS
jgi:hypothetical protein